ncbi:hypothetical protein BpHYR1_020524 [Brachionus plicatilis]|uniref:Uncharacterized protein n=1 Tax=Brachionus plicatilis TaxID=10195 RepID=A0A3M7RLP7_BRAPC|nr:hypothetical protein BpHYR1_020524 [Brachionus plicatilis]
MRSRNNLILTFCDILYVLLRSRSKKLILVRFSLASVLFRLFISFKLDILDRLGILFNGMRNYNNNAVV